MHIFQLQISIHLFLHTENKKSKTISKSFNQSVFQYFIFNSQHYYLVIRIFENIGIAMFFFRNLVKAYRAQIFSLKSNFIKKILELNFQI